jgi:hypothetical protein
LDKAKKLPWFVMLIFKWSLQDKLVYLKSTNKLIENAFIGIMNQVQDFSVYAGIT